MKAVTVVEGTTCPVMLPSNGSEENGRSERASDGECQADSGDKV